MKRSHALVVSVAVAGASVAGGFAVMSAASAGTGTESSIDQKVAQRTAQLDRYQASLQRALTQQLPDLPGLPDTQASSATQMAAPARVVYRRSGSTAGLAAVADAETEREESETEHADDLAGDENEQANGEDHREHHDEQGGAEFDD
jgi:hypothetical protein